MAEPVRSPFGDLVIEEQGAVLRNKAGELVHVPVENVSAAVRAGGYLPVSPEELQRVDAEAQHEAYLKEHPVSGRVGAATEGAARGLIGAGLSAFQLAEMGLNATGVKDENNNIFIGATPGDVLGETGDVLTGTTQGADRYSDNERLRAQHGGAWSTGGELVGAGLSLALGGAAIKGGVSLVGKGAALLRGGGAAAETLALGAEATNATRATFLGRLASAAREPLRQGAVGAVEGGYMGVAAEREAAYRENRAVDTDALLTQVQTGAMLGFGLGAAIGGVSAAFRGGARAVRAGAEEVGTGMARSDLAAEAGELGLTEIAQAAKSGVSPGALNSMGYLAQTAGKQLGNLGMVVAPKMKALSALAGVGANAVFRREAAAVAATRKVISSSLKEAEQASVGAAAQRATASTLKSKLDDMALGAGAADEAIAKQYARIDKLKTSPIEPPARLVEKLNEHKAGLKAFDDDLAASMERMRAAHAEEVEALSGTVQKHREKIAAMREEGKSLTAIKSAEIRLKAAESKLSREITRQNNVAGWNPKAAKRVELQAKVRASEASIADAIEKAKVSREKMVQTMESRLTAQRARLEAQLQAASRKADELDAVHKAAVGRIQEALPQASMVSRVGQKIGKVSGALDNPLVKAGTDAVRRGWTRTMMEAMKEPKLTKPPATELSEHLNKGRNAVHAAASYAFNALKDSYKPVSGAGDYKTYPEMQFRSPGQTAREAYFEKQSLIRTKTADMMGMTNSIAEATQGVDHFAPEIGAKMKQTAVNALNVLNSAFQGTDGVLGSQFQTQPNPLRPKELPYVPASQIDSAERTWNATVFPGQFLDEFAMWNLSPETITVARQVYPDMVAEIQLAATEQLAAGFTPTKKQEEQLSALFGIELPTMNLDYQIRYSTRVQSAQQQQAQAPKAKPGSTGSPSVSQQYRTLSQSSSNIGN